MKRIRQVSVVQERLPLKRPYHLSFATLTHFESIQVKILLEDGSSEIAEVVPLPGYNEETPETVVAFIESHIRALRGLTLEVARKKMETYIEINPFAVSPILTAIDLFLIKTPKADTAKIKFVIPTSISKADHLKACYEKACQEKRAIKIKLTGETQVDLEGLSLLKTAMKSNSYKIDIRFDANQAYSLNQARTVYNAMKQMFNKKELDQIEYIEQPLKSDDWEGPGKLVREFENIKTMLDESIITRHDVEKANKLGIRVIKLKLFKQGGIKESLELARFAQSLGISTVYGNGVASYISNKIEFGLAAQYPQLFYKDSEANGFLKIKE